LTRWQNGRDALSTKHTAVNGKKIKTKTGKSQCFIFHSVLKKIAVTKRHIFVVLLAANNFTEASHEEHIP